jgi:hypothetical protein
MTFDKQNQAPSHFARYKYIIGNWLFSEPLLCLLSETDDLIYVIHHLSVTVKCEITICLRCQFNLPLLLL